MKDILNSLKERLLGIWRRFYLPLILAALATLWDIVISDVSLRGAIGFLNVELDNCGSAAGPCSVPAPIADGILLCLLAEEAAAFFLVLLRERTGQVRAAFRAAVFALPPAILALTGLVLLALGNIDAGAALPRAMQAVLGTFFLAAFAVPFIGPAPRPDFLSFAGRLVSSVLLAVMLALAAFLPHYAFFSIVPLAASMDADAALGMARRCAHIRAVCRCFLFTFFFLVFLTREKDENSEEEGAESSPSEPGQSHP